MAILQPHLKCKRGDIEKIVLLPGDPGRIDRIIKYWDTAKEVSYNREFRTCTGKYKGIPISAVSTGVGCSSAAIAIEEAANLGAEVLIRIGTCGALKKKIKAGDLVVPYAAVRAEGTTKEYIPPEYPAVADAGVTKLLIDSAKELGFKVFTGVNRTHDAFYETSANLKRWSEIYWDDRMKTWEYPLVSSEMECSAIFILANLIGLKSAAVLDVNTEEPLDEEIEEKEMYDLKETPRVISGIDKAIKTAHRAVEILARSK